jgi:hypothetical protein
MVDRTCTHFTQSAGVDCLLALYLALVPRTAWLETHGAVVGSLIINQNSKSGVDMPKAHYSVSFERG